MQADGGSERQVYVMPRLDGLGVLSVLAATAEAGIDPQVCGLLLAIGGDGWHQLILPAARGDKRQREATAGALTALCVALQSEAGVVHLDAARTMMPYRTEGAVDALEGGIAIAAASGATAPRVDTPPPERLTILLRDPAQVPEALAAILRQGRDVRVEVARGAALGQMAAVMLRLDDAAARTGSVSSLLGRRDLPPEVTALRATSAGQWPLWLPLGLAPPDTAALSALGRLLAATGFPPTRDLAYLPGPDGASGTLAYLSQPEAATDAGEIAAAALDPVQPFDLQSLDFKTDVDAARDLAALIAEHSHRIGYRVSLRPVGRGISRETDLEHLYEQIEVLRNTIDEVNALGAPQRRLLRFSDAQVPAMIDGLRRLPQAMTSDGSLLYAAGHSSGLGEPAHYLMYDPSMAQMRLPEAAWRARTEDRPIGYWLEPFVAEARSRRPTKTRVFVPEGYRLVPSLADFGGDIDGTLRLVLGTLFGDVRPMVDDPDAQPMFLFTDLAGRSTSLRVEVIDRRAFRPLQQKLGWINDYLEVRGSGTVDQDTLRKLADELYQGKYVDAVRGDLARVRDALQAEWSEATDRIRGEGLALARAYAEDMEAVQARIGDAHAYLAQADRDMRGLEQLMQAADAALRGHSRAGQTLSAMDAEMAAARDSFADRVRTEIARGEAAVEKVEARIARLRDRLDRMDGGWR